MHKLKMSKKCCAYKLTTSLEFITFTFIILTCADRDEQITGSPHDDAHGTATVADAVARDGRDIMPPIQSKFSDSYLPPVMQALAYYVELLQYEPAQMTTIEPPYTLPVNGEPDSAPTTSRPQTSSTRWTTTQRTTTTVGTTVGTTPRPTTTQRPATTTRRPWGVVESTTQGHKPGQYAPPPQRRPQADEFIPVAVQAYVSHRPSVTITKKPFVAQTGPLPILSISNNQYFDWYLQNKAKQIEKDPEYELQFLHPLPSELLQDILYEPYDQPALNDADNINEFRRVYDDFYGRVVSNDGSETGKKRIPPTRPYVQFLMLYDLLKREAKRLMLQTFEGYNRGMLQELKETTNGSAERQLYVLMYRLLQKNEIENKSVVTRIEEIMKDLIDPNSVTSKAFRYFKPLSFEP